MRHTDEPVVNAGYEMVPIERLTQHPRNPNRGDVSAIAESIEHNGFYGAVVAQRSTGHMLAGNHRLQAAVKAGLREVPVIWLDVDDREALRILLADNQLAKLATYDEPKLHDVLKDLSATGASLAGTGYSKTDLEALAKQLGEEAGDVGGQKDNRKTGDAGDDSEDLVAWGVIVEADSEAEQVELLLRFSERGLRVRAIMGG